MYTVIYSLYYFNCIKSSNALSRVRTAERGAELLMWSLHKCRTPIWRQLPHWHPPKKGRQKVIKNWMEFNQKQNRKRESPRYGTKRGQKKGHVGSTNHDWLTEFCRKIADTKNRKTPLKNGEKTARKNLLHSPIPTGFPNLREKTQTRKTAKHHWKMMKKMREKTCYTRRSPLASRI